jgi:hypothetical protein
MHCLAFVFRPSAFVLSRYGTVTVNSAPALRPKTSGA